MFNLLYNNLLINLRFHIKVKSYTCGLCCFDLWNTLQCYCFLKIPCRDKCCTIPTIIKWVIKGILIGVTFAMIRSEK